MRKLFELAGAASLFAVSAVLATPAMAQSTGSQAFDAPIVVTAKGEKGVGGIADPDT